MIHLVDCAVPVRRVLLGRVAVSKLATPSLQTAGEPWVLGEIHQGPIRKPHVGEILSGPVEGARVEILAGDQRQGPLGLNQVRIVDAVHLVRSRGDADSNLRPGRVVFERREPVGEELNQGKPGRGPSRPESRSAKPVR